MGNSVKLTWHTEKRRLGDLIEWDKNPRQLKDHDAEHLKKSLDNFGVADPLIINTDNRIIGGHMRRRIMLQSGYKPDDLVDVRVPERELTEREAEELAIRLNKNTGDWDFDALANNFELDDLLEWGFEKQELDLDLWAGEPPEDVEPQIDKAEELREKWGVESGQLWKLGEHRIICGDCTDKAVVDRVMGGEKAEFCFTDPPYGVKYTGGTKKWAMLENDDSVNMYAASIPIIREYTTDKAALYLCYAGILSESVFNALRTNGYEVRTQIIWVKNHAQFGAIGAQYKQNHENIAYAFKRGKTPYWFGPNNEITTWEISRANKNEYHPTEKPVELYERAIKNSAPEECIVFEPFSGSGTAIIACARLGRKCRAVEISPAYVAVAIQRWVDVTGGTPELVEPVIQR
jgi:DNA modification methylase